VFESHQLRRIALTTSCHDADALPKVAGAGDVIERDGVRVQVMHNGVVIEEGCYYGAWMTEIIRRLRGHHEPQEEAAFALVVERLRADSPAAPVMVELGSFWAYYSLWFARALPQATLVLVEPDPGYVDVGRRNLELNGVSGRFIQAAVGLPDGAAGGLVCESDGVERPATLLSVDGLMRREALERVDVLLCDTQGAELAMLDGARRALAGGRIRFLVVSTHHHSICGDPQIHERCLSALRGHGAHVIAEHTVAESFSGDGLIVASLDPRDRELRLELSRARARDSLFGELEPEFAEALASCRAAQDERDAAIAQRDALAAELERVREAPRAIGRRLRGRLRGWPDGG
jgi:FkbM family methyltransferase